MAKRPHSPRSVRRAHRPPDRIPRRRAAITNGPSHRTNDLLRAGQEHRERMLEQIYCVLFEFARDFGISAGRAGRAFRKAERLVARSPYRLEQAVQFQTLLQISDILGTWYREPAFLGESGDPRPLPIVGAKSFASLVRRFLPQFNPREIVDILIAERLLERDSHGEVVPLRRAAVFASTNPMMLDRVPVLIHGLLGTLRHNTKATGRRRDTRCERSTTIERLPVQAVPAFNEQVKKLAQSLLNQTDSWAGQRQAAPGIKSPGRVAQVGVEVFAYVEDRTTRQRPGHPR